MNPFHYRMLFTSFGFLFMAIIAAYHDYDYIFLIDLVLFLTSVNYWRHPLKDWRRKLDIFVVSIVILSHSAIIEWDHLKLFLAFLIIGLYGCCKGSLSNLEYIDRKNITSVCHSTMHILVVILFVITYESQCPK